MSPFALLHDVIHLFHSPGEQLFENRAQRLAALRECILHPGRNLGVEPP